MSVFSKFIETIAKQAVKLTGKKAGRVAGEPV